MSTDNRTTLNDCSSITGWTGDDAVTVTTLTGLAYEGSPTRTSLSTQMSNADEHMYTTSIGGTRDLSDATCYMLVKDNLVESQANGGVKYVLSDGTDVIGYEIGGYDNAGLSLQYLFNSYKFDVSNSAAFTAFAFAGSEANLAKNAITGVGFGTFHLSKAQGAIDNCFLDRFSFIANGSAALTVNGGTVGTPIDMAQLASDDFTNGWGLVSNITGEAYKIFCPTEWGDTGTASTYFEQVGGQIFLDGTGIGAGNFDMDLIANSTGTNSFVLNNVSVINLGAVANWTMNPANHNIMKIDACQFVDGGTFALPTLDATNKWVLDSIFTNCGQVNPSTCTFERITFNGTTDANGALLLAASAANMKDISFVSDGTGHAIYITATGTYDLDGFTFSGYGAADTTDAVVYNNSGGAVTLNMSNSDTPTVRNGTGASTTVNNNVTVTFTGMKDNTEIRVYKTSDGSEVAGIENATAGTADNRTFAWSAAAGLSVYYVIHSVTYETIRVEGFTVPSTASSIPIQQRFDRNNFNPT
jgi:hypothetical protein